MGSKRKINMKSEVPPAKQRSSEPPKSKVYEDLCLRFPSIAESIFDELDNQCLVKCREVSREWSEFLSSPKFVLVRKIKKTVETRRKFRNVWRSVVKKLNTNTILQLEAAVNEFFGNVWNFSGDQHVGAYSDIDSESYCITPIHVAAGSGNTSLWKALVEKVDEIQPKNERGQTPLHEAVGNGHFEMTKLIINSIDDKNPGDNEGWTALHFAAQEGYLNICKFIMNLLVEKNPKTIEGWTPLHIAAHVHNGKICKYIASQVEDKNPENNGITPLQVWNKVSKSEGRKLFM